MVSLLAVAALVALALVSASRLTIDPDLTATLPAKTASVQALGEMEKRFGGVGTITVVGRHLDPDRLQAFADDIAPRLARLPHIRWVDHRRPVEFFSDHALYWLPTGELAALVTRVEDRIAWERRKQNPMLIDLEESDPPELELDRLESSATGGAASWIRRIGTEPYYSDPETGTVIVMAKPLGLASDLSFTREVVGPVRELVAGIDASAYGADAEIALTGRFPKRLDQQSEIASDLRDSSLVALLLVVGYLALHFRRIRAVGLVLAPLLVGLAWMFGLAGAAFGQLNILTTFAGVILLGLGIDHGIHLLSRYERERAAGAPGAMAVQRAFMLTGRAVLIAALTTTGAFASLAISEFLAFRQFGILTAFGTVAIVLAYGVCLPALLALSGRGGREVSLRAQPASPLARSLDRWGPTLLLTTVCGLGLLMLNAGSLRFDPNFGALQETDVESFELDDEVNRLLGYSQTPLLVMAESEADAQTIAARMRDRKAELGARSSVDFVATVSDLVPRDQPAKRQELERLSLALTRVKPSWLAPRDRDRLSQLTRMAGARPFGVGELPEAVRRQFQRPDGTLDRGFALVFSGIDQSDGDAVRELARELRSGPLDGIEGAHVASEALVLADVLEVVEAETPTILVATTVVSFLVIWALLSSLWAALLGLLPAFVTLVATAGLLPLAGVELNYLNVVMLPALFGMSLDGALHLVVQQRAGVAVGTALEETGRGIAGSILTTGLGFGALLLADQRGLTSIAELVLLGLAVNLLVCIVGVPALLATLERRARRRPNGCAAPA